MVGKINSIKNKISRIPLKQLLIFIFIFFLVVLNSVFAVSGFSQVREDRQGEQSQPIEEDPNTVCLEEGKELFAEQEYDEAVKQLEKCKEQDPDNPEIYYYIAQSYFQQGQQGSLSAIRYYRKAYDVSDQAIEKYHQQIEENPDEDHVNEYLQLAYIYQIRSLVPGVDEYQEALDIYQKLLEENPQILSAYYHMGWIYYQQEDYQNTIDTYLKYLEAGVKSDFVYYHLGLSYDKIGEKQKAKHYFKLILEEFPDTDMADRARKELE